MFHSYMTSIQIYNLQYSNYLLCSLTFKPTHAYYTFSQSLDGLNLPASFIIDSSSEKVCSGGHMISGLVTFSVDSSNADCEDQFRLPRWNTLHGLDKCLQNCKNSSEIRDYQSNNIIPLLG